MRMLMLSLSAAILAATLVACDKAPAPPSPPSPPAAPAAPAPTAVVTYDCHSPQKSRDFFVRFDADGTVNMGADAASLKPIGEVVTFDKSGMASWSKQSPNGSNTSSFNKNTGEWDWAERSSDGQVFDSAQYYCKGI